MILDNLVQQEYRSFSFLHLLEFILAPSLFQFAKNSPKFTNNNSITTLTKSIFFINLNKIFRNNFILFHFPKVVFFTLSSSPFILVTSLQDTLLRISYFNLYFSLSLLTHSLPFESLLFHRVLGLQFPLPSSWTTSDQTRIFLSYLQLSPIPGEINLAHGPFPRAWTFVDDLSSPRLPRVPLTPSFRALCGS